MTTTEYIDAVSLPITLVLLATLVNYVSMSIAPAIGVMLMFICYYACIKQISTLLQSRKVSFPSIKAMLVVWPATAAYSFPAGYWLTMSPQYAVPFTCTVLAVCLIKVMVLYKRGYYNKE